MENKTVEIKAPKYDKLFSWNVRSVLMASFSLNRSLSLSRVRYYLDLITVGGVCVRIFFIIIIFIRRNGS